MHPGMTFAEARAAALEHPCGYRAPARRRRPGQAAAATEDETFCGAEPGTLCRDPRTGASLTKQAAHLVRLRAAGVAAPPRPSPAVA